MRELEGIESWSVSPVDLGAELRRRPWRYRAKPSVLFHGYRLRPVRSARGNQVERLCQNSHFSFSSCSYSRTNCSRLEIMVSNTEKLRRLDGSRRVRDRSFGSRRNFGMFL